MQCHGPVLGALGTSLGALSSVGLSAVCFLLSHLVTRGDEVRISGAFLGIWGASGGHGVEVRGSRDSVGLACV